MIILQASTLVACTLEQARERFAHLDEMYPQYCPREHVRCVFERGDPLTPGSRLAFEERVGGRVQHLRYEVARVEEDRDSIRALIRARFPRSLLGVSAEFTLQKAGKGVEFARILRAGSSLPLWGRILDGVIEAALGRAYLAAMVVHNQEDMESLGRFMEASVSAELARGVG